jgi:hypothetical protein
LTGEALSEQGLAGFARLARRRRYGSDTSMRTRSVAEKLLASTTVWSSHAARLAFSVKHTLPAS